MFSRPTALRRTFALVALALCAWATGLPFAGHHGLGEEALSSTAVRELSLAATHAAALPHYEASASESRELCPLCLSERRTASEPRLEGSGLVAPALRGANQGELRESPAGTPLPRTGGRAPPVA